MNASGNPGLSAHDIHLATITGLEREGSLELSGKGLVSPLDSMLHEVRPGATAAILLPTGQPGFIAIELLS